MKLSKRIADLSPKQLQALLEKLNQQGHSRTEIKAQARKSNVFPLSFTQERLWFLDQLNPGSASYNICLFVSLSGTLNMSALQQSLHEIERRHDTLRTSFAIVEGAPVQVIAPPRQRTLSLLDLQLLPESAREAEARRLASQEGRRLFDLFQGPLWRAKLLRLAEEKHVLLFTIHHMVFDAWSRNLLIHELEAHYQAFSSQKPWPLPELPIQYVDFVQWQRKWQEGKEFKRQLAYWKKQLSGDLPVLDLPTDHPRPAVQSYEGARQAFSLSGTLANALRALSQQEGVTLFMTLLAAFKTLLYRYTGQEDMIVGSPSANRNRIETEQLIGFFANNLVLRTDLSGNPTFRELLARVREVALGADAHQELPFQKLVEALQPERNLSYNPLFQVMFTLKNLSPPTSARSGLSLIISEVEEIDQKVAVFDLTLDITENGEKLSGEFEYNRDLFDPATIERMIGHYQSLLEGIVANPAQPIATLPILTEAERHKLLIEWNNTSEQGYHPPANGPYALPDYHPEICFHELVEAQAACTPDAVALVYEDQQLTYHEFNRRANQLAHHLQKMGVGPEVLVGICMERSLEMIVALFAILKAGGAYLPLDPSYPKERLAFMLQDSEAALLLTQERLEPSASEGAHEAGPEVICVDSAWQKIKIAEESDQNPLSAVTADNLAYIIYTSGSTGKPKGVLIRHRGVCSMAEAEARTLGVGVESRVLQFASLSFDGSVFEIAMTLPVGATLCLGQKEKLMSGQVLREQAITVATLPPSLWACLSSEDYPTLQTVLSIGEACTASVVAEWAPGRRFFNPYGPTETTCYVTIAECVPDGKKPTIGRPILNAQIYILDQQMQPVPIGVPGELYIGAIGIARGYKGRPALTAEKFIPNPFSDEANARLYKTGDLVCYLPDGNIDFLGRIDHQVQMAGVRVELGGIEALLDQHPDVQETVVLAREDSPGDKRLVAYVIPHVGAMAHLPEGVHSEIDSNELRRYLSQKVPNHMVPSIFLFLDKMPRTPNGKVDRQALPPPNGHRKGPIGPVVIPQTKAEQLIADVWQETLKIEKVGIHDNFFDLGGYSLLMIQIHKRLQDLFGPELSIVEMFGSPTIHSLAQHITQRKKEHKEQKEEHAAPQTNPKRSKSRISPHAARQMRKRRREMHRQKS